MRVGRHTLSFSAVDHTAESHVVFEPYIVKSGVSMAANLRMAFPEVSLLGRGFRRVLVMVDCLNMLVPVEEYQDENNEELYLHTFTGQEGQSITSSILPNLNAVAVFGVNKDLKTVVADHFTDIRYMPLMQPVWAYLHKRSFTGNRRKEYGYFHDGRLEIFSFQQNHFKFYNVFDATHARDSVYFLLYVWKQLGLDAQQDELHLVGDMPERDWMRDTLRRFVQRTYIMNPVAEFNRAPITAIREMPFDLMAHFIR